MNQLVINPSRDLFFDYKVKEMCESCKRYGKKATCPPHIESVDYYSKLLPRYKFGIIYYEKFDITDNDFDKWKELGKKSSLKIHKKIILERNKLFNNGHYYAIGFGAGSCKWCNECTFPCKFPEKSLIPFEAAGIDIVKLLEKFNIKLEFPIKKYFYRVGVLFWD